MPASTFATPTTTADHQDLTSLSNLQIQQVTLEADEVVSLRLIDPAGAALPVWEPGAHVDVVLPSGLVRQYSLCGDPRDRYGYTVSVLREPDGRGGSTQLHECARVGSTLTVRGPRNHFRLEPANRYLFIAGGIGITPILAMVREAARGTAPWRLHYAGRSLRSMAFRAELHAIGAGKVELFPSDQGRRIPLEELVGDLAPGTQVYCCGPSGLIEEVTDRCGVLLPEEALHVEHFTAAEPANRPAAAHEDESTQADFDVELKRTGCVVRVLAGQSVLDAVRDVAPDVMTSCEEGFCGTCETAVIDGVPEHLDTILSAKERERNRTMMICVGRASSSRLVLDL